MEWTMGRPKKLLQMYFNTNVQYLSVIIKPLKPPQFIQSMQSMLVHRQHRRWSLAMSPLAFVSEDLLD